jgi:hypothetical protein
LATRGLLVFRIRIIVWISFRYQRCTMILCSYPVHDAFFDGWLYTTNPSATGRHGIDDRTVSPYHRIEMTITMHFAKLILCVLSSGRTWEKSYGGNALTNVLCGSCPPETPVPFFLALELLHSVVQSRILIRTSNQSR